MSNTDNEWLTYEQAGALTGLSARQLRRHISADKIRVEKRGRRRLLHRGDLTPFIPAAPCEVVPVEVGGLTLQGLRFGEEEEVIATRLIEQTLGYEEGSLRCLISRTWVEDFDEGVHFRVLTPTEMRALHRTANADSPAGVRAASLHVLTEQGVGMVLLKSGSQKATALRKALVMSGFMRGISRAVMNRDGQALAQTLSGSVPEWVGGLIRRQDERMDRLESLVMRLVEAKTAPPAKRSTEDYYEPIMRAEEVCKMLAVRFPELRDKPRRVHDIARDCGLVDPLNGSGDSRFTRRVVLGADRGPTRFFSPAAVDKMAGFLRGGGRLDFSGDAA